MPKVKIKDQSCECLPLELCGRNVSGAVDQSQALVRNSVPHIFHCFKSVSSVLGSTYCLPEPRVE